MSPQRARLTSFTPLGRVAIAAFVALAIVGCGSDGDEASAISLTELLDSGRTGSVVVDALVYSDATGTRLCEVFAESYPVQCMGRTIEISNPEAIDTAQFTREGEISWTDQATELSGDFDGTTLTVETD